MFTLLFIQEIEILFKKRILVFEVLSAAKRETITGILQYIFPFFRIHMLFVATGMNLWEAT